MLPYCGIAASQHLFVADVKKCGRVEAAQRERKERILTPPPLAVSSCCHLSKSSLSKLSSNITHGQDVHLAATRTLYNNILLHSYIIIFLQYYCYIIVYWCTVLLVCIIYVNSQLYYCITVLFHSYNITIIYY